MIRALLIILALTLCAGGFLLISEGVSGLGSKTHIESVLIVNSGPAINPNGKPSVYPTTDRLDENHQSDGKPVFSPGLDSDRLDIASLRLLQKIRDLDATISAERDVEMLNQLKNHKLYLSKRLKKIQAAQKAIKEAGNQ